MQLEGRVRESLEQLVRQLPHENWSVGTRERLVGALDSGEIAVQFAHHLLEFARLLCALESEALKMMCGIRRISDATIGTTVVSRIVA